MPKPSKRRPRELPDDVAVLLGPTADGRGARLTRLRKGELSVGEIRPVPEGRPLNDAELVRLAPLEEGSAVYEVETVHAPAARATPKRRAHGPARVSNETYRRNWSAIFGARRSNDSSEQPN